MNIPTQISSEKEKPPLTRSDVQEQLQKVGSSDKLKLLRENISGSDLSYLNLSRADLSGANLSSANLSFADLSGAKLSGANLREANLSRANLGGADLSGASLSRANLRSADLILANLILANLGGADLHVANFSRADLSGANLSGANLIKADLSKANLSGANLIKADLSGANLSGANLNEADLSGTNLSRADLSGADLTRADLSGADLSGANLLGADLDAAHFSMTKITLDPRYVLFRLGKNVFDQKDKQQEKETDGRGTVPGLRVRILEDPLTAHHLRATLDILTSLYVKAWLLQQGRFDDFIRYSEHKDSRFEEEANLRIAELKYNSPADIKFSFDLSPKSFVEAIQMLLDTITQLKLRKQMKEEEYRSQKLDNLLKATNVTKEHLDNTGRVLEIIEKLSPELDAEKKMVACQSLMKDIMLLASDKTLEISLRLPPAVSLEQKEQDYSQAQKQHTQPSEKLA